MAAQAPVRLKRWARRGAAWLGWTAAALAAATVLFFLAGWIGSSIPRNPDWREPAEGVDILIETNGVHTGVVVPIVNQEKDWRETFPSAAEAHAAGATHIAVGWGEREVFLHVPTWGDLKPGTALRIATAGGESIVRLSHYVRPTPGENHRPLRITTGQYRRLAQRIEDSLAPPGPSGEREILRGSDQRDAYYTGAGRYTLLRTSNTWTGDVLGDAGIRIGSWTPFQGGVMKWIPEPEKMPGA